MQNYQPARIQRQLLSGSMIKEGCVAIATHSSENAGSGKFGERLPLPELERLAKQFDAIQTHNIQHGINKKAVRVANEYERPKIGGSDFHIYWTSGYRTHQNISRSKKLARFNTGDQRRKN